LILRKLPHRRKNVVTEAETIALSSEVGGAEGIRTPDLLLAKQALSRLSYSPMASYFIKYRVVAKASGC
jgi:hypothetical protein